MKFEGFHGRAGFGRRPALVVIDVNLGFTDPESPLVCELDDVVVSIGELLTAFRSARLPVAFTTVSYDEAAKQAAAAFIDKIPALLTLEAGSRWTEIDPRIAPLDDEPVFNKLWASAFFGTPFASFLAAHGCDSLVVTGASTSGCVRATVLDALQHGYRPIVPAEAVGDRNPEAHAANLYDMDTKYGDVVPIADVLQQLGAFAASGAALIVRDAGSAWQVVLQPDHADLCADFARSWAEQGPRHDSLVLATERHDDGWAVWEQSPLVDAAGKPVAFLDVQVPAHLAFYRACIAAVTGEDAYAGLLVSMHGAGIYRQRYGIDPGLKLTHADEVRDQVEAFVAEQEESHATRAQEAGVDEERRWADYGLLQIYDLLSLYFCLRDVEAGEAAKVGDYTLEPVGPWRVRIDPYPFAEPTAHFTLRRRLVPKQSWTQPEFRAAFPTLGVEDTPLELTP